MEIRRSDNGIDLSIVIPTYNAKVQAHDTANVLQSGLSAAGLQIEIILVDDGSRIDQRPELLNLPESAQVILLDRNKGKGFAVRTGLLAASGRCRVFTDVDLPYGVGSLLACYDVISDGRADVAYGDRSLADSRIVSEEPASRRLGSAAFRFAVWMIAGLRHGDTQCGVKGFRGDIAESLVPLLKVDGFAFDVEILRSIRDQGLVSRPIAVHLRNGEHSTVRLFRDSWGMLRDLVAIRIRALQGHYKKSAGVSDPARDRLKLPVAAD